MGNRSLFFEHIDILIILNHFIMKKRNLKSLSLNKKLVSNLETNVVKGGTANGSIANNCLGKPSLHCGSLSCESFACPTEEWTVGYCDVLFG